MQLAAEEILIHNHFNGHFLHSLASRDVHGPKISAWTGQARNFQAILRPGPQSCNNDPQ